MKVQNIRDLDGFFRVIDECTGKVELVCEDMRLNLKSKLTQYVALANIFSGGHEVPEMELIAYNQEDVSKLIRFMMAG